MQYPKKKKQDLAQNEQRLLLRQWYAPVPAASQRKLMTKMQGLVAATMERIVLIRMVNL